MPRQADKSRRRAQGPSWQDPSMRIGDVERNGVADALSQHFAAGRLDDAELKERLDRTMSAKTGADLAGLMTDLPPLEGGTPPPVPHRHRPPRTGLWIVVGAVLVLTALAHGPMWWPWWMAIRIPWIVVAVVVCFLWRRSRRRRWQAEAS